MTVPHLRLLFGAGVGLAAVGVCLAAKLAWQSASLIGWNVGALVCLAAIWPLYVSAREAAVRARAAAWDEPAAVIALLIVAAIAASLCGVLLTLSITSGVAKSERSLDLALAGLTLITSWFVVQSLMVGHYARRRFQDESRHGDKAGFLFPCDPPRGYVDFAYLAICVGGTAQVSDPGVQSRPLGNLVTAHAVTAFFYNTAVLALGVNILSSVIGR